MKHIDKENVTADLGFLSNTATARNTIKKSRSKSVGPGTIDALAGGSNVGNRGKVSKSCSIPTFESTCRSYSTLRAMQESNRTIPVVKSILKPSIPLSPLREIPLRRLDRAPPSESKEAQGSSSIQHEPPTSGRDALLNTSAAANGAAEHSNRISVRTEEEQQAAAREREERVKREQEKSDILQRREARRKSMGERDREQ